MVIRWSAGILLLAGLLSPARERIAPAATGGV
jgi:hypothetical protein